MSDTFITGDENDTVKATGAEQPEVREERRSETRGDRDADRDARRKRREERRASRDDREDRDDRDDRRRRDYDGDDRDYDRDDRDRRDDRRDRRDEFTFSDLARTQNRASMGGVSDAALAVMIETFEKKQKAFEPVGVPDQARRSKFKLVPLDTNMSGEENPALLVCLPLEIAGKQSVLVYILLIEKDGDNVTRPMTERGETYDALILPEDQLTKSFREVVEDQVSNIGKGDVVIVGSQVILADTVATLTEKDSVKRIEAIFDNALDAVSGYRENILSYVGGKRSSEGRITPELMGDGARLEVSFDYTGKQIVDTSGLPIRSDSLTQLYYSPRSRDRDRVTGRTHLGEVRAGLDMFVSYNSDDEDGARFGSRRRRRRDRDDRDQPFWQAVLNVNSIATGRGIPYSLEMAQLLLAQVALQSNNYRWASILRPKQMLAGGLKPVMSLGHLYLMHPDEELAGVADDVNSPNISDDDLGDFLDMTVHPDIIFGMTVPSSGEKSWILSIFEKIAMADLNREHRTCEKLRDQLFSSADTLTDSYFREALEDIHGDAKLVPVKTTGSRILLGTWIDTNGNTRDLREWNVPAVAAEVGEKNLDLVYDFQATFSDRRHSPEYNLAQRYAILKRFVPGIHVSGTCEQLALSGAYMEALSQSLDQVDMSPITSTNDGLNTRHRVGSFAFRDFAVSDIGFQRQRRDDRDGRRRRGGWSSNNYY